MDLFGINSAELLVLLLVAAVVVGPERLPGYAEQLGHWVRQAREFARDARGRIDSELGDTPVDWAALDPRKYDPRQIVRQALLDDDPAPAPRAPGVSPRQATAAPTVPSPPARPAPFDDEAT